MKLLRIHIYIEDLYSSVLQLLYYGQRHTVHVLSESFLLNSPQTQEECSFHLESILGNVIIIKILLNSTLACVSEGKCFCGAYDIKENSIPVSRY